MEVTLDLNPEAMQVAEELAAERQLSVAEVVSDAILRQRAAPPRQDATLDVDDQGFPQIRTERSFTPEEIKEMIAEDEEWEITRGDPNHPYYADHGGQEPIVTRGPTGLPEVRFGKPSKDEG